MVWPGCIFILDIGDVSISQRAFYLLSVCPFI